MTRPNILILFGGGLDSGYLAAAAYIHHQRAHLLHFDYGQKAYEGEALATRLVAQRFGHEYSTIKLPSDLFQTSALTSGAVAQDQQDNEVVGRNLVFAALGFALAARMKIPLMYIGADPPHSWQGFNDQKQPTFDSFNALTAFAYGTLSPRLQAPLLSFADRISYLRQALVYYPQIFEETFSCYESMSTTECGVCVHCKGKEKFRQLLRGEQK